MGTTMDPRVLAIMAQFEKEEKKAAEKPKEEVKFKPPTNLEEFMKVEALKEWPQRLTSEGILDIRSEADLFGNQEDLAAILREAAPLGLYMLQELEDQLDVLENKLMFYAEQIVSETRRIHGEEEDQSLPPTSPARTFITEVSQSDAVKSQSHRSSKGHRSMDFAETLMDAKKKSIEYCQFPGFRHGELIELPGQLESPPILHRVTKAQDFNSGFKRFWKKLFLSEASVAVMQDTFWWFFLNKYESKCQKDKDLLYDRIADSYVALFTSIHKDVKDKFLSEYPNCLSQAVYAAYFEAFPESRDKLEDSFKQELANVIHEWVTGLKPVPGTWKTWDVKRLEKPKGLERESEATKKLLQVQELNNKNTLGQEMDSFSKIIDSLGKGDESHTAYTTSTRLSPTNVSREVTKMTTNTTLTSVTNGTFGSTVSNPLPGTISQISPSRLATRGTTFDKPLQESHQIGPGPDYERVMFNTQGRSPLISHYLHMRQLRDYHQPGKKVRRTEIAKLPPPGPTYRQLIQNTLSTSAALKKEYQKICEQTNTEIRELERKQRDTNREINRLTRELIFNKNPLDLKILSEKIVSMRERDTKEITLIEKDPDPTYMAIKNTAENGDDDAD